MNILFKQNKFEKLCNDRRRLLKEYGAVRGRLIAKRLDELKAAEILADVAKLPQTRCHQLSGEMNGMLSVDVGHPYRLIFLPADTPIPLKADGGLDWDKVKTILIVNVIDTH